LTIKPDRTLRQHAERAAAQACVGAELLLASIGV